MEIKCKKCRSWRLPNEFLKKGKVLKSCYVCRENDVICRDRNKCIHGSNKIFCSPCGGSQACEHKHDKKKCRLCNGSDVCEHTLNKRQCKSCHPENFCEHGDLYTSCQCVKV